jgi:hypothetical protein
MKSLKNYLLRGAALLMLLGTALPAMAQTANNAYIFYNATYGYLINNGGNPGVSTTFNKNAIWVANNTMGGTSRNVHSYTDDSKYFTGSNGSALTNGTFSLGTSNNQWRINNNYLNRAGNTRGYVRYNGSGFIVNQSNASQNFTGLAITINSSTLSNPTISITAAAGLSGGGIQLTGNVTGTYTPAYYYASVRNYNNATTPTYYWTTTTDATTTQPASITSWGDATRTWTVTTGGAYASVSSDGLVTITGNPTGNIVVTLTVTKGGYEGTQTFTLTRAAIAQNVTTETVISGPSISPSSAALYYNEGSQAFTSSASATATTYNTPAHTTLTGGGNTYYYYNGTLYTSTEGFTNMEETHPAVTLTWALSGAAASYLTRTPATGTSTTVTHSTQIPSDQTATLTVTASATGASNKTATATVTAYGPMATPTITRSGNTISLATTSIGATIYYTTDGSTPTASSTPYTGSFELTTSPTTVKAIAIRDGHGSPVATETFQIQLAAPTITVSNSGLAAITAEAGATIHYTTDGTIPTASSPTYSAPVQLTNPQIIMAIATRTNYATSDVAMGDYITTGVSGTMVILDDREDHRWSYYSDASLPEQLHSLNPADVKITYYGDGIVMTGSADYTASSSDYVQPGNANYVGGAKVNVGGENENTFVYYKTLERENADGTGRCPYKPIPNPFQVRPTYGSTWDGTNTDTWTGWRGFQCWRLKSVSGGSVYSVASSGTALTTGAVINAETEIYFAPTAEYGMEVELEAVWAIAYVVKANGDAANAIQQQNVGYERNFIVLHSTGSNFNFGGTTGKRITNINYPVTVSTYYPEGTQGANAGSTLRGDGGNNLTLQANTKFENIEFSMGSYSITAANHDVIVGRGCTGTVNLLQGINANATTELNYTIRVESGTFNELSFVKSSTQTVSARYYVKSILGCDYDRATNTNNLLSVSAGAQLFFSQQVTYSSNTNRDAKTFDLVVKSGEYQHDYWNNQNGSGGGGYRNSFYCGPNQGSNNYPGIRYVVIEGGEMGCLNGGRGTDGAKGTYAPSSDENPTFTARIKGGLIHGAIFGGAADSDSPGSRRIIVTGGTIEGWIAAGANGTGSSGGSNSARSDGNSYIYVGGDALVGGPNVKTVNLTVGGQVFGAGRGQNGQEASVNNSNVVVADEAEISGNGGGNVYGGGYTGYVKQVSNVYVVGGTVENKVCGGAYGNAATIPTVNVTMTGGTVNDGVYGGSDNTGTVGNVTMHIDGGTVGNSESGDGVFGGGYGSNTSVNGNVSVTLGDSPANSGGVTVYGNVYGGSALGDVNTNSTNTTIVTLNKGTVNGNLFGGALGEGADVNGKITVTVNGGTVNGNVFGGGDAAAYSPNADYPVVNITGGQATNVFGGGMGNTAVVTGNPQVTLSGSAHVTGNVYGGGNAAPVTGSTSVILQD